MDWKQIISDYQPEDDIEAAEKASFLQFIDAFGDKAFARENLPGHFSASAWVVNPARDKVLMIFHNMFNSWAWIGGHADGVQNLQFVAVKEMQEETGVENVRPLLNMPLDINVLSVSNHVKKGKFVPRHLHYNVVYLFEADETVPLRIKPDENSGVAWIKLEEIPERCLEKHMVPYYGRIMRKVRDRGL